MATDVPEDRGAAAEDAPILIVPYMWVGDFVRNHTAVQLLNARLVPLGSGRETFSRSVTGPSSSPVAPSRARTY